MILKGSLASQPIAESLVVGLGDEELLAQALRDFGCIVSGPTTNPVDRVLKIDRYVRFSERLIRVCPFLAKYRGQKVPVQLKTRVTKNEHIFESTTEREQLSLRDKLPGGHPRYVLNPSVFQGRDYMTQAVVMISRHTSGGGLFECVEVSVLREIADRIYQENLTLCTGHTELWIEPAEFNGRIKMHRRWDERDHYWKTLLYIKKPFTQEVVCKD